MQQKNQTVIFIVADEKLNAGERDYTKALAHEMTLYGLRDDIDYLFYKIPPKDGKIVKGDPRDLPLTNKLYAKIPHFDAATIEGQIKATAMIKIIGAGNSTLPTVDILSEQLRAKALRTDTNWITHMPSPENLQMLIDKKYLLFAPVKREKMVEMNAGAANGNLLMIELDAVPHTNSEASCQQDYARFAATPQGKQVREFIENEDPFAFAVLNGGFEVGKDRKYTPYTVEEAQAHGLALGKHLPPGTHLILAHGGPRNLRDETPNAARGDTHEGQNTISAFAEGYMSGQAEQGAKPTVIQERYAPNLSYDVIKAGYILGRDPNCVAFISNSEGYGTMNGAVLHINNQKKLLGMFSFAAQFLDHTSQYQANLEKYNKKGVALLSVENGELVVGDHPQQGATPVENTIATRVILSMTGTAAFVKKKKKSEPTVEF